MAKIFAARRFALSFEVYPPKTDASRDAMYAAVKRLAAYRPGFISCTYGAGGSTRTHTLDIVTEIARRFDLTTTAHLTCVGSTVEELCAWLREAASRGISNIMALRGDPPRDQATFTPVAGGLRNANELVALIRARFPRFGIGVAGYPETHQEASSPEEDLRNLKRKVDAGADAVFTQLFYDNADFWRFRDLCRAAGITVPIVPGILPIVNFTQVQRITKLCKACIPERLLTDLEKHQADPTAQQAIGLEHATRQCQDLIRGEVPGIHFYVLNQSHAAEHVLGNLELP
jgi:methylenetetrahydrofolate reductase (NADPH)